MPVGLAMLLLSGCDDAPPLNEGVRRRLDAVESEQQKAAEEIARKRAEREGNIPSPADREARPSVESTADAHSDRPDSGKPSVSTPSVEKDATGKDEIEKNAKDGDAKDGNIGSSKGTRGTEKNPDSAIGTPIKPPTEAPQSEKPPPGQSSSRAWGDSGKWRQLRGGMRAEDVQQLLGPPTASANDIYMTYWYYGQGNGAGKVAFTLVSKQAVAWDIPLDQ